MGTKSPNETLFEQPEAYKLNVFEKLKALKCRYHHFIPLYTIYTS